tara:strand:- start:271 stop:615 length:345 start_codon:yes stop_codon:yes gene_type:complete
VYQGKDRLTDHQLFLLVDGQWLTFPFPFVHHQPLRGSIFYVGVNERGEEKTQDYQPSKRELRFEAWSLVVVFSSFPLSTPTATTKEYWKTKVTNSQKKRTSAAVDDFGIFQQFI